MNQRAFGAIISYVSIFINIAIALIFTPYLVRYLGQAEFGLFNLIGSFAAYLIVLDMGMNDAVIRFLLKYKNQTRKQINFLSSTFVFYTSMAGVVVLLGMGLYFSLSFLFQETLSHGEILTLKTMTVFVVVNAFFTVLLNPVGAYLIADQRFVFVNASTLILRILTTLIIMVFLAYGYKATAVVAVTVIMNISMLLIKVIYAFKLGMRVNWSCPQISQIDKLLKYSAPIFFVVLAEIIYWKLDQIILGNAIGASIVAVYAIGMMFHKYFMSFSTAISKVMMPEIVLKLDAGMDALEMEKVLTSISRIQAMVILLILSGLILFGESFIRLWLNESYIQAYDVMILTLIPYSLELMGNVRNIFLQVYGFYWYRALVVFGIAFVNIFATIWAVKIWGMKGAAISTGVAIIIGYSAVNYVLWKKLQINILSYLSNLFRGLLPSLVICFLIGSFLRPQIFSWTQLVVSILAYSLLYVVSMWFLGMNEEEKSIFKESLTRLKSKLMGHGNVV